MENAAVDSAVRWIRDAFSPLEGGVEVYWVNELSVEVYFSTPEDAALFHVRCPRAPETRMVQRISEDYVHVWFDNVYDKRQSVAKSFVKLMELAGEAEGFLMSRKTSPRRSPSLDSAIESIKDCVVGVAFNLLNAFTAVRPYREILMHGLIGRPVLDYDRKRVLGVCICLPLSCAPYVSGFCKALHDEEGLQTRVVDDDELVNGGLKIYALLALGADVTTRVRCEPVVHYGMYGEMLKPGRTAIVHTNAASELTAVFVMPY